MTTHIIRCCLGRRIETMRHIPVFWIMVPFIILMGIAGDETVGRCQGWDDIKISLLPDTSFAVVENDVGKIVRHCPHHDINGNLDVEQLIYVLGTLDDEVWVNPSNRKIARKHLEKHYNSFIAKIRKNRTFGPFNLNEAKLSDLVRLPIIGPVLAVKIVEYRYRHRHFQSIEEIQKIDGIGPGIFTAIRHYIYVD